MARFMIGDIVFWVSPVAITKSFLGAVQWAARGTPDEMKEFRTFYREFFPYLLLQPNDMDLDDFCNAAVAEVDALRRRLRLESDMLFRFGWRLKNTLNRQGNRAETRRYAQQYCDWLESWMDSPTAQVAQRATAHLTSWSVKPMREGLAAVGSFGGAIGGKYVPGLRAVCVQMDVVCQGVYGQMNFIETLLHEQVHAAIHHHMGEDARRNELPWFRELAAILTSQHAIFNAARELHDDDLLGRITMELKQLRTEHEYGDLTTAVLHDTHNSLVAWRAWQEIFRLPPYEQRDYGRYHVIKPLLHRVGWRVEFPYYYGHKHVSVFI